MKKTLFALILSSLAFSATASPYVQADLGYSNIELDAGAGANFDDNVFSQRISVGYGFERFRVAADYTNFGKIKLSERAGNEYADLSVKFKSIGLSAFYDFKSDGAIAFGPANEFIPYVGLRLSNTRAKGTITYLDYTGYVSETESRSDTGFGGMIGGQYFMTENFGVNVGVEYSRLFSKEGVNVDQYGAKVGVRYSF